MGVTKFEIEFFDRNFHSGLWKLKMKSILVQNKYEKALLRKSQKPPRMSMKDFEEMNLKALSIIYLCLYNSIHRQVVKEEITGGVWLKLESLYMTKPVANLLLLRSKLHDLHIEEGGSLKTHIDEFNSIVMGLSNLDVNLDDEDFAIKLLCSLLKEYKHFRETIVYRKDVLTLEDVKGALLQRELIENQLTKSGNYSHDGEGLVVKGRP